MNDESILKRQLQEFKERWPLDLIRKMTISEYTLLGGKDTFTYWLESKSDKTISIWGGSSYKFGIFNRDQSNESKNDRPRLSSDGEYSWYTKYGSNKQEVFEQIKNIIIEIIERAQNKEFEKIDKIDLGTAVKWKIAYIYAPYNSLLRFVSDKALNYLQQKYIGTKEKSIAKINENLLSLRPQNLSVVEYSERLWTEYKEYESKGKKKYWLYAPGENANRWEEFYNDSIMALGWDDLGDLNLYKNKDEIVKSLQDMENTVSSKKNDATANYDFVNNLSIGDIIIAKQGRSRYLGYGIVESDYVYDEERSNYRSVRKVNWKKQGSWEEEKKDIVLKTLTDITKYKEYVEKLINLIGIEMDNDNWQEKQKEFREWAIKTVKRASSIDGYIRNSMNKKIPEKLVEIGQKDNSFISLFQITDLNELETLSNELLKGDLKEYNQSINNREPSAAVNKYIEFLKNHNQQGSLGGYEMNNQPLNQILYGPPGTGKTYHTINKAIEIIENRIISEDENREDLKKQFEIYKQKEQIEFVTFHQSYGYEEFVEGIKAIPSGKEGNEDGEEMIYEVMPGILKKLSTLAKNSKTLKPLNQTKKFSLNATQINIQAEMIQDDENSFRVLAGSKIRKAQTNSFKLDELKQKVINTVEPIEEDEWYVMQKDYTFKSMSGSASVVLGRAANGFQVWKEIESNEVIANDVEKNYILIIDEINRGNISKIFGELITLIEDSKRAGNDEVVEITLPYSGEKFSVPNNLFILGTMNTADRSIALMDTALRRRFEFIEMMPNLDVVNGIDDIEGINIKSLLETINKRIEYLYDRDHTIGHAYFTSLKKNHSLKELNNIFRNKIIPLLQEYFYDDWEKIQIVFGDHYDQLEGNRTNTGKDYSSFEDEKNKIRFIQSIKVSEKDVLGFDHDDINDERTDYRVNKIFNKEAYLKLC